MRGALCFRGRRRRGTRWKGAATRARAKERADWPKAMRRPRKTEAGRHAENHDRRPRRHESSSHRFFMSFFFFSFLFLLFCEAVSSMYLFIYFFTSLVFVALASCIPFIGNDPRACRGTWYGIIAMLHFFFPSKTVQEKKKWRSLVFLRWLSRFSRSFFPACARVVTLTAPQTSGVFAPLSCSRLPTYLPTYLPCVS